MADPTVHITNGVPDQGTGNISTIGMLMADGGQATLGSQADAAYVSGSGSAVAVLKGIFAKLAGSLAVTIATAPALVASAAVIGKVGIDQTTPGTTNLVQTPTPASVIAGQAKIAVTSTVVALGSNALVNGIVVKAAKTNVANILIGPSGVTTTYDGTGNGYCLEPGAAMSFACSNTNLIFINGTAGDFVSFGGN